MHKTNVKCYETNMLKYIGYFYEIVLVIEFRSWGIEVRCSDKRCEDGQSYCDIVILQFLKTRLGE